MSPDLKPPEMDRLPIRLTIGEVMLGVVVAAVAFAVARNPFFIGLWVILVYMVFPAVFMAERQARHLRFPRTRLGRFTYFLGALVLLDWALFIALLAVSFSPIGHVASHWLSMPGLTTYVGVMTACFGIMAVTPVVLAAPWLYLVLVGMLRERKRWIEPTRNTNVDSSGLT